MIKQRFKAFYWATILIAIVSAHASVAASDDLHELTERVQVNKQKVLDAEEQKRKVLASLYSMQLRMKKISQEKNRLTDDLIHIQDNVKNLARVIATLELEIKKQKVLLRSRLRTLYKISGEGYINILFSMKSPAQIDETMRHLKMISDNDYQLIHNFQDNVNLYRNQKEALKVQVARLFGLEKKIKVQEGMIASEHQSKMKIVAALDQQKTAGLSNIKVIRSRFENTEIDDLLKPSIFEQKGSLTPPVAGSIVRDFGLITDEKYKFRLSHKGLEYATAKDAPVASVFAGKVVFLGNLPGYGQTMIVDHGDHYFSVYGHLARPSVSRGEAVKKAQVLALVADDIRFGAPTLYFEIRHFSEPENPRFWLARATEEKVEPHLQAASEN
jgi:septal ring factor EnvC (AmiA/AmiB activator)